MASSQMAMFQQRMQISQQVSATSTQQQAEEDLPSSTTQEPQKKEESSKNPYSIDSILNSSATTKRKITEDEKIEVDVKKVKNEESEEELKVEDEENDD